MADATADAKKAIQASYDRSNNGLAHKETKSLIDMYTPDYYAISKKGKKTSLAELKESIKGIVAAAKTIKASTTVQKIVLKGNEAIVTTKEHTELFLVNPQDPSQTAKIVADDTSEHTWVKSAKGWLLKKARNLTSKATMNGQPMPDSE